MLQGKENSSEMRVVHLTSAHAVFDVRIFYKECQSLARAGYSVMQLSNHSQNTFSGAVEIRGLGRSRGRLHRVTTKLLRMAWEALQIDADVYHLHDPELLALGTFLRYLGKRVVYDIHEDLPRTMTYKRYLPELFRAPLRWVVERSENFAARRM